jgi:NAD-dependent deacetylase
MPRKESPPSSPSARLPGAASDPVCSPALSDEARRLGQLITGSDSVVVLTGAGISVPSGIPDFRTPGKGIWEKVDPMEVAHIDSFRRDPALFWSFYRERLRALSDVAPNRAHEVLVEMEREGLVRAVITQNIDTLHERAGQQEVIEVHGSIRTSSCSACGAKVLLEDLEDRFDEQGVAGCPLCLSALRPDVVLFGEMLPPDEMLHATQLAAAADLLLCIGSSLEVHPVAGLPEITIAAGGKVGIVTQGPTPYDEVAEVVCSGDVVAELEAALSSARD